MALKIKVTSGLKKIDREFKNSEKILIKAMGLVFRSYKRNVHRITGVLAASIGQRITKKGLKAEGEVFATAPYALREETRHPVLRRILKRRRNRIIQLEVQVINKNIKKGRV